MRKMQGQTTLKYNFLTCHLLLHAGKSEGKRSYGRCCCNCSDAM